MKKPPQKGVTGCFCRDYFQEKGGFWGEYPGIPIIVLDLVNTGWWFQQIGSFPQVGVKIKNV